MDKQNVFFNLHRQLVSTIAALQSIEIDDVQFQRLLEELIKCSEKAAELIVETALHHKLIAQALNDARTTLSTINDENEPEI